MCVCQCSLSGSHLQHLRRRGLLLSVGWHPQPYILNPKSQILRTKPRETNIKINRKHGTVEISDEHAASQKGVSIYIYIGIMDKKIEVSV